MSLSDFPVSGMGSERRPTVTFDLPSRAENRSKSTGSRATAPQFHSYSTPSYVDRSKSMGDRPKAVSDSTKSAPPPAGYYNPYEDDYQSRPRDRDFIDDFDVDVSDADSVSGFPFYAPSVAESDTETLNEKPSTVRSSTQIDATVLQTQPGREVYNIKFSKFRFDDYDAKDMGAELKHEPTTTITTKTQPLFRWIHMNQDDLDFEAFCNAAKTLPGLTEVDDDAIKQILKRTKNKAERPLRSRDGPKGRTMRPIVISKLESDKKLGVTDQYLFLNLPYFSLHRCSTTSLPSNSHLFPSQPLVQSQYSTTSMQRELRQAVCQLPGTPDGHCLHVTSLWCLVIGNKYLVTCARKLSAADLHGEVVEIEKHPPVDSSAESQLLHLMFENGMYLIPTEQCRTWFKMTQLFSCYTYRFDDKFVVYWRGRQVNAAQWPAVIKQVHKNPTKVFVTWREHVVPRPLRKALSDLNDDDVISNAGSSRPSTPNSDVDSGILDSGEPSSPHRRPGSIDQASRQDRGRLSVSSPTTSASNIPDILLRKPSTSPMSVQSYLQDFHALRWIAIKRVEINQSVDQLEPKANAPTIALPKRIDSRKSHDEKVETYLDELHQYMEKNKDAYVRRAYRKCSSKSLKDVEKALAGILRAKLDDTEALGIKVQLVTAFKSIYQIFIPLDQKGTMCDKAWGALHTAITGSLTSSSRQRRDILSVLHETATRAMELQAQLSHGKGPDPMDTDLPPEFVKAWYHFLICQLSWHPDTMADANKHARKSQQQLNKAYELVMSKFDGKDLNDLRAVLPAELLTFPIKRVLQDFTGEQSNVLETYWRYCTDLESSVKAEPLNRFLQTKIAALKDEIDIVSNHVRSQVSTLTQLTALLRDLPGHEDSADEIIGQFHVRMLWNWVCHVEEGTLNSLRDLSRKAQGLANLSKYHIENNKDRQESAIYVFTIVTIIFLPISTVSSIFGMNTNDVRNMPNGQWVFWAAAIPITIVVVVASLVGAGVLTKSGFQTGLVGSKGGTYLRIPDSESDEDEADYYYRRRTRSRSRSPSPPYRSSSRDRVREGERAREGLAALSAAGTFDNRRRVRLEQFF